jgi:hypothetical protein
LIILKELLKILVKTCFFLLSKTFFLDCPGYTNEKSFFLNCDFSLYGNLFCTESLDKINKPLLRSIKDLKDFELISKEGSKLFI